MPTPRLHINPFERSNSLDFAPLELLYEEEIMGLIRWELSASWPVLITGLVIFFTAAALHRRYFSGLSDIPGPFWASITRLWHVWVILQGKQNLRLKALHDEHGPFVRIAPNEVSVSHPDGSTRLLRANLQK